MILFDSILGNKKKCVLVFSPLSTVKNSSFGWWKTLKSIDATILFIKDTENKWYLDFYPDGGFNDFSKEIINEINKLNLDDDAKIFCVGPSMGGFAAFYYAKILGATSCFATSIEETLNLPGSISTRHLKKSNCCFSLNKYLDNKISYYLFVGELDFFDLYSASRLPDYVNINVLPDTGHLVPNFLANNSLGISGVVNGLIGDWDLLYKRSPFAISEFKEIISKLYEPWVLNLDRKSSNYEWDNLIIENYPRVFKFIIAKDLYFANKKEESLEIMLNIVNSQYFIDWDYYHFLGLIFRDLRRFDDALHFFKKSEILNPAAIANSNQIEMLSKLVK
ncbi:hypothetical protein [Comamonas aquatica]|uniref:hypothetical protein n=1 Tax=Comamonas aquatica TaxID=225991 RepID=UPI0034D49372